MKTFSIVAALAACAGTALGIGPVVSLDGTRTGDENEAGGDRFLTAPAMTNATNILLSAGFTISTTDRFYNANIQGACVLYTGTVNVDFDAQELNDISAFVAAGGGLVIQRDWDGFYPSSDALLSLFGVTVNTAGTSAQPVVSTNAAHPIWNGPAGAVLSYDQVFSSFITGGATIIGNHSVDGTAALGVLNFGAGRVVIVTDMDAWDDQGDPVTPTPGSNNAIVWENIFHYACVPSPGAAAVLGMGGLVMLRRRR